MLCRKKGRKVWIFRTMVNGKTWERSTGETDRKRALAKVAQLQRLAQLQRERPENLPQLSRAIVREVARIESDVSPRQAERVSIALMNFLKWAGDLPLEKLTAALLERYQRERLTQVSRSTVDKELTYLVRLLRQEGFALSKPRPKPGRQTRQRALTSSELKAFFAACPADLRALFLLMLATGACPAELIPSARSAHVALLKQEVDLAVPSVVIRSSKVLPGREGESRTVVVEPQLAALLEEAMTRTPGLHVFPSIQNLHRTFDRLLRAAGIEKIDALGRKVTAHSFRHTFATLMAQSIGGNPFLLQRLLGHKDIKTSALYCHLTAIPAGVDLTPYLAGQVSAGQPATQPPPAGKMDIEEKG